MNLQQVIAGEQVKYQVEIKEVMSYLDAMGMKPDTEIRVYPLATGWYATVLVGICVLIFTWYIDRLTVDIHPFSGFFANGGLIHE
jgi:hypothetical protein